MGRLPLSYGPLVLAYGAVAPPADAHATVTCDFHAVPWELYRESRDKTRRSSHDLRVGGYYALMDAAAYDSQLQQTVGPTPASHGDV